MLRIRPGPAIVLLVALLALSGCGKNVSPIDTHIERARRLLDQHKTAAALAEVDRARASESDRKFLNYDLAGMYLEIGNAYLKLDNVAEADNAYQSALSLAPNDPQVLNNVGYSYADAGIRLDRALTLTRQAAKLQPNDPNIIDSLGWAEYKSGDHRSAVRDLRRAVELSPDQAELRYHLAAACAKAGMHTEAWIEAKKALLLKPSMTEASNLLKTLHK